MAIRESDLNQLLNQAKVTLTGVSDAGLRGAFYDVLTEFFNDSSCWTQDVQFTAITTMREYSLEVPEGQIIRLNGICTPVPATANPNANSIPAGVYIPALMAEVGTVVLQNAPQEDTVFVAQFVTNVSLPVDRRSKIPLGPSWALPIWHVGLLDGLLGKMMLQPNKGYSNMTLAQYHLKRFRDAIQRARVSKLRANTIGSSAWRFPQQFRMNTQRGGIPSTGSTNERTF